MSPLTDLLSALERGDPIGALLAAVVLAAAASSLYLAVLIALAATTTRRVGRGSLASALPGLRRVSAVMGAGLLTGLHASPVLASEGEPEPPPTTPPSELPVLELVEDDPPVMTVTVEPEVEAPPATAPIPSIAVPPDAVSPPQTPPRPAEVSAPDPDPQTDGTWRIQSGDHLWHVAQSTLEESRGRPASERETGRYWVALVEANRDRLIDPENPDLVHPGQEMRLPPVSDVLDG